ncbi:TPA: antirestriction protein ArdR [Escherichia coli]|nr:antirestriction protein ArdR [Escherichia coli]
MAKVWRQHNPEHADSGVILIWDGKVYCWKNILRAPQHERPRVIAVDTEENVFIAESGNEYDGAKCWVVDDDDSHRTRYSELQ